MDEWRSKAQRERMRYFHRLRGDLIYLRAAMRTLRLTRPIGRNPTRLFPDVVDDMAARHGGKPALVSDRESLTYRALVERSCRYARWARAQGLAKGEVVALMMPNRPEYLAIWLGIVRAGGTVALLNTNLSGSALAHCIDVVAPRCVVVDSSLLEAVASSDPYRKSVAPVWVHGCASKAPFGMPRIDAAIDLLDGSPLSAAERPALTIEDKALFIYTSGTTGMPKAANINHFRLMLASLAFAGVMDTKPDDRMYDCLPMYHTSGGICATGAMLAVGGTVFIREKFSAGAFWDDVVSYECTAFMYIGELCRYLVNAPPQPNERAHRLRIACGNGLQPEVWNQFKARFSIPTILEFYAATEGNVTLFNFEGKEGSIGRIPWFLKRTFPMALVRFDLGAQAPLRNARGFCEETAPGEIGEAIGRIFRDPSRPTGRFEGYADAAENERKILHDVFVKGDTWFRSGDLMRQDAEGYFYFVDRVGDTYRWKGENISTMEVATAICSFAGIREANVYGVAVPGREGRAGMAAIVADPGLDLVALRSHLAQQLPDYARPVFLRIGKGIDVTATFKQRKLNLMAEGFDPKRVHDPVYVDDPQRHAFVPLTDELYRRILNTETRF
jgi:fatty-acyl-CoA synthase